MNTLKERIESVGGLEQAISIPVVMCDLSSVSFGIENLNDGDEDWDMPGYKAGYEMIEGVEVLFAAAGDDSDKPIAFVIYTPPGTDMLRGYVPKEGNCFDKERNKAYDGYDESEYSFSMDDMRAEVRRFIIRNNKHLLADKLNGKVTVGFKKVHPDAKLPTYAHPTDTGMDVCAVENTELKPNTATLVRTGIVADIPDGYEIQVRSRSGLALKQDVIIANGIGSVDASYRGEIGVIMKYIPPLDKCVVKEMIDPGIMTSDGVPLVYKGIVAEPYIVNKGDKIAQLVLAPVTTCNPVEVQEVSETERGEGGFGSTGK